MSTWKALSVHCPWAHLIQSGEKTIEIRKTMAHYRGEFVVCSGLKKPRTDPLRLRVATARDLVDAPLGVTLCIVRLVNARPATQADRRRACLPLSVELDPATRYAWELEMVAQLRPRPVRGALGFWKLDDENVVRA